MYIPAGYKKKTSKDDFGWHSRGKLPHLDSDAHTQFITFRLVDSVPQELVEKWRTEAKTEAAFRKKIETCLDSGLGKCWLGEPDIAEIVENSMKHFDGVRYDLHAWVIMPNHCHLTFTQYEGEHLSAIMHSIKSFTAQNANKELGRQGQFWQHESFDRYIRDARHFRAVVRYIEMNPVKARLCAKPEDWRFSSAFLPKD